MKFILENVEKDNLLQLAINCDSTFEKVDQTIKSLDNALRSISGYSNKIINTEYSNEIKKAKDLIEKAKSQLKDSQGILGKVSDKCHNR